MHIIEPISIKGELKGYIWKNPFIKKNNAVSLNLTALLS